MTNEKMGLNGLFSNQETQGAAASSTAQLQKTAQLTSMSTEIVNGIINVMNANVDTYQPRVVASQKSHDEMDKLINDCTNLEEVDIDFLKAESEEELEKMIRSQQSKRSRAKSKVMTMDNYKSMMIGAVAENLLRLAMGKPKGMGGGQPRVTDDILTDEYLAELAADPEKLKKAIRNVQSKKSIAKSKANFDENSDRWKQLLTEEETLKSIRGNSSSSRTVTVVDKRAEEVKELLKDVDLTKVKSSDAKGLLDKISAMLGGGQPTAETENVQEATEE